MQTTFVVTFITLVCNFHPTVGGGLTGATTGSTPVAVHTQNDHQNSALTRFVESYKQQSIPDAFENEDPLDEEHRTKR